MSQMKDNTKVSSKKEAKKLVKEEMNIAPSGIVEEDIKKAPKEYETLIEQCRQDIERCEKETRLFDKHDLLKQRFVNMYVSGQYTNKQIARILMIGETTVSSWLRNPDIVDEIVRLQTRENLIVDASLKALRLKAVNKANELMSCGNPMVESIMVRDVLDRTGHKAIDKKEVNVNMTYEERLTNLIENANEVLDVEVIDDEPNNNEGIKGDE